jgi:hypothetical protein
MIAMARRACRTGVVLGVFGLCSACATQFDPANSARIHTIALAGFNEPDFIAQDRLVLRTFSVQPRGASDFAALMAGQNLHLGAELKAAITQALRDDGYEVVEAAGTADAVLDVKIAGAPPNSVPLYESAAGNYEPEFSVIATLKDAKTKHTLFLELYDYRDNSIKPIDGSILIRPDPKYGFRTAKELFDNPRLAAEGFRAPVPLIAQSIGAALKKP